MHLLENLLHLMMMHRRDVEGKKEVMTIKADHEVSHTRVCLLRSNMLLFLYTQWGHVVYLLGALTSHTLPPNRPSVRPHTGISVCSVTPPANKSGRWRCRRVGGEACGFCRPDSDHCLPLRKLSPFFCFHVFMAEVMIPLCTAAGKSRRAYCVCLGRRGTHSQNEEI